MCTPLMAAAAAGTIAGGVLNSKEQADTQNGMISARNNATRQEMGRQEGYGAETRGIFDKSLEGFSPDAQGARLSNNQVAAAKGFAANQPLDVGTITSATAPSAVGAAETGRVSDAFRHISDSGARRGALTGYATTTADNNRDLTDSGRRIDTVGDFSKVSAGINKSEQDAAYRNAYRPNSGIGDVLKAGGQLGSFYAGKGGLPFDNMFGGTPGSANPFRMGFAQPGVRA